MTVSSSTNRVSYSGNGTLTVFAYTFKVFDESDLTVILRASDGTETVQTITTHYTVSGVGDVGGGNITFVTAPTATQTVVILREQPLTQGLDLVPNDPFPAESLEESFDKLTFMVQQHEEELGRAIKASRTNTITTTEFVESASDRANKVIAFDGSGDLDLTQEIGTFRGNWVASTAYAVRDIVKDTNNNNIYIANTAHTSSGTVPLSSNADIAKWDLLVDAAAATTSANNAATSATAAATSATAAATSATAAATSESNAATSASNASTSETNAASSASNASTSESNAAGSESAAATSESNAATSATNASTSASAAATSATNAATSEAAAAASQSAAATSETNAATSATSAATNATNAATSASNASTAQTAAETAQTAAEAAQAAAELAADNFDDTYLGSKSSDPTVDNDGGALNAGDLYFNTTSNTLKVYSGSAWQDAAVDSSGFVQTTGDTMTGGLNVLANVGIGTSSPTAPLEVIGGQLRVAASIASSMFLVSPSSTYSDGIELHSTYNGGGSFGPMKFYTSSTERMRIDSSGNVGIGCVPNSIQSGFDTLQIGGNLTLNVDSTGVGAGVYMGNNVYRDSVNSRWEYIYTDEASQYLQANGEHIWRYAASGAANSAITWSEAMRIDSSGNLLVGGTITNPQDSSSVEQFAYNNGSYMAVSRSAGTVLHLNRISTDGEILTLRKDGSAVGSIYNGGGNLGVNSSGGLLLIDDIITPTSAADATHDIGRSSARYKDLYLSGGVYLGGTGSANLLDDYEEGTFTPTLVSSGGGETVTYTYQVGNYVKNGKLVYVNIFIKIASVSGGSGQARVSNLPFTVPVLSSFLNFPPTPQHVATELSSNGNFIAGLATHDTRFTFTNLGANDEIRVSGSYAV